MNTVHIFQKIFGFLCSSRCVRCGNNTRPHSTGMATVPKRNGSDLSKTRAQFDAWAVFEAKQNQDIWLAAKSGTRFWVVAVSLGPKVRVSSRDQSSHPPCGICSRCRGGVLSCDVFRCESGHLKTKLKNEQLPEFFTDPLHFENDCLFVICWVFASKDKPDP